jgi:hypothetical protein
MVCDWPCTKPKTYYYDAVKKLVDQWAKCFEKQKDYVEK